MIDLTENQIVDPPIQCWIKKSNKSEWDSTNLYGIDHRLMSPYICSTGNWQYCTLTDPTVPTKKIKKWLTIEDVPAELFGKVLIKGKNDRYTTAWILEPCSVNWKATQDLVYLPLGQPLTGEWLPFESEE